MGIPLPVHVVSGCRDVHHLDGAAGQSESQRPNRVLPTPVQQVVEAGQGPFPLVALEVNLHQKIWRVGKVAKIIKSCM